LKAEPLLTVDPSMRLQQEVQTLRVQKSEMDELKADIDKVKELLKKG